MNLKNVENKEKNTVVLTVEVPAEEFNAEVDKVYRKQKNRINVPGFRKGKAPRKIMPSQRRSWTLWAIPRWKWRLWARPRAFSSRPLSPCAPR